MEKSRCRTGAASDLLPSFLFLFFSFFTELSRNLPSLPPPPQALPRPASDAEACLFKRNPPLLINPLTPQKMRAEIKRGQEQQREARFQNRSRINTFSFFIFSFLLSWRPPFCFVRLLGKQLRFLCHFVSARVARLFFFFFYLL